MFFDEAEFRRKIPFELIATNLHGAFTSPAPPADFDPNTASAAQLVKHGILWRRPAASDDPALVAAWQQVFSRKWHAKHRIVPVFEAQIGKTHTLRTPVKPTGNATYESQSWSGAAIKGGGPWSSIVGFWKVPTVSQPSEPQGTETEGGWKSSSWIGIDGYGAASNDVLQAGVEQYVDPTGQPSYTAWYEWAAPPTPQSPPYIGQINIPNFTVSAGDQIYCAVQYVNSHTAGYIYFANETSGENFSITLVPPPGAAFAGNSAEWIMEAPDWGLPVTSLPKFTPVAFTGALACGAHGVTGNPKNADVLYLETLEGQVLTSVTTGNQTVTIKFTG